MQRFRDSRMGDLGSENVAFYFADLIFVVCQSTVKTTKISGYMV